MLQFLLFGCIVFPFLAAIAVFFAKDDTARRTIVFAGTGLTAFSAVLLAFYGGFTLPIAARSSLNELITVLDFCLLLYILALALRLRSKLTTGLALAQICGMVYLDFVLLDHGTPAAFTADPLSLIMVLVISLVGGVIGVYGLGYMKEHEEHLRLQKTRQPRFFFLILLFLGAMNGLVLSDSLPWMFFFWEVTTLCSFMLIGHDGTSEAKTNALRALWMNMVGGLGFVMGMLFLQKSLGILSVQALLSQTASPGVITTVPLLPLAFLCFAGFTKAAQLPFQSWLCGAMVAPTPVSALLHSSTMVKAGVYLVLRLSPAFMGTTLAAVVALMGAFTFFAASALAVGQSNGKKILAYSTIANLGLIISCAGIGSPAAITAAILLIIFHAVSKGLLFLCVGAIEQHIGSRDIEKMRGLYQVMPCTAIIALIGMVTMMLPPFGALLAKWMAIEAAATTTAIMPLLVVLIAFGSALTVLFWSRWAGIIMSVNPVAEQPAPEHMESTVRLALQSLTVAALSLSLLTPFIFRMLQSSIVASFGVEGMFTEYLGTLSNGVGMFAVYPLFALLALGVWYALRESRKGSGAPALPYLSGIQVIKDGKVGFYDPLGNFSEPVMSNYYLQDWFGEAKLTGKINTIALVLMAIMLGGLL